MKEKPLRLNSEWLRQKYEVERLSTYDIAKIVGRDPKGVYTQLKRFGIPTRPRGENLTGADNFMKQPGVVHPFAGHTHTPEVRAILSEKASVEKPWLRGKANGMSGRTGATNPNYIDGSSPERQRLYASAEWKEVVRFIFKRDNYLCVRCGSPKLKPKGLHAHHLKAWAGNPSLRFDTDNIVTLCRACHDWVHSRENVTWEYISK